MPSPVLNCVKFVAYANADNLAAVNAISRTCSSSWMELSANGRYSVSNAVAVSGMEVNRMTDD